MYPNMPDIIVLATRPILHSFKRLVETSFTDDRFTEEVCNEYLTRLFTVIQIDDFADARMREFNIEFACDYRLSSRVLDALGEELLFHIRDGGVYTYGILAYTFKYMKGDGSIVMERILDVNTGDDMRDTGFSHLFGQRPGI